VQSFWGTWTLGAHASVWYNAVLRGDMAAIVVGENTNLQDGTIVHVDERLPARIGARVGVGHRAILHGCTVEDDCLIAWAACCSTVSTSGRAAWSPRCGRARRRPLPRARWWSGAGTGDPPGGRRLAERIRDTWEHYVAEAKRHRAGTFPIAGTSL